MWAPATAIARPSSCLGLRLPAARTAVCAAAAAAYAAFAPAAAAAYAAFAPAAIPVVAATAASTATTSYFAAAAFRMKLFVDHVQQRLRLIPLFLQGLHLQLVSPHAEPRQVVAERLWVGLLGLQQQDSPRHGFLCQEAPTPTAP